MKLRHIVFSILMIGSTFPAMAWWGMTGHRVVGEIADMYLSSKARRAIKDILGDESLAMAANWADFIKSDTSYNYLSPWHYTDMKGGLSHDEVIRTLDADTGINLYAKLNFVIGELKNKQLDKDKKIFYLRLLVHLVGDLHQPLHVGGRTEDAGGNRVRVIWFSDSTNLHSVWDEKLIEYQKLSYTEWAKALAHTTKAQRLSWQKEPIQEWFFESYQLAQGVYAEITKPYQRLSYRYNFDHAETINQQLLKGGVRLAGLLNEIFG